MGKFTQYADSSHRAKDYKPLLTDYRALIVDEAHKLPEAARQMYGLTAYHHRRETSAVLEYDGLLAAFDGFCNILTKR